MDKKKTKVVFGNIFEFVSDLNSVFKEPKKTDPFNMYFRIISGLKMSDETGIVKVIDGFKTFMIENSHLILNDQLKSIRSGTKILYGDNERIYISISKYINQSDDETLKVIREHLLNILKDTNPETEAINQLKTLVSANYFLLAFSKRSSSSLPRLTMDCRASVAVFLPPQTCSSSSSSMVRICT